MHEPARSARKVKAPPQGQGQSAVGPVESITCRLVVIAHHTTV